jgi:precorrin-2/cobalt-factor-2 C20-methyltransferase
MRVRKTSVYLPDRLKDRLHAMAASSGRPEANLIRVAIERLLDDGGPGRPEPASEDPTSDRGSWRRHRAATLYGVGVGPGDAGLLTVRALDVLRSVDRVFAPTTALDAVGRAEMIVREASPDVPVERLTFVMERDGAARDHAIEAAGSRIATCLADGETVAFVTLGDPNVYSTFSSVADVVRRDRPGAPIETVPGIMAFQDLAARSGTVLVDGVESLTLLAVLGDTNGSGTGLVDALARPDAAVVIYKGGRHLPAIADRLRTAQRCDAAVLGELLGLPGQRLVPVSAVADRPASYLATVIVPPVRSDPAARR